MAVTAKGCSWLQGLCFSCKLLVTGLGFPAVSGFRESIDREYVLALKRAFVKSGKAKTTPTSWPFQLVHTHWALVMFSLNRSTQRRAQRHHIAPDTARTHWMFAFHSYQRVESSLANGHLWGMMKVPKNKLMRSQDQHPIFTILNSPL